MNKNKEQKPQSKLEELTGKYTYVVIAAFVVIAGMFCYALAVQPLSIPLLGAVAYIIKMLK